MVYRKALILGLGISGASAAHYLLKRNISVTGVDKDHEKLSSLTHLRAAGAKLIHESEPLALETFDLLVVSPGVPPTHPIYQACRERGIEIVGEIELACRNAKQICLGITGSNGKTTTTFLVAHALKQAGFAARAIGNIGVPMTEAVDAAGEHEILVVELSSWQLETLKTPFLSAAALLNITPNHLDRHETMENYALAKFNIQHCLKPKAPFILGIAAAKEFNQFIARDEVITYGYATDATLHCDEQTVYMRESLEFHLPSNYRGRVSHDIENCMAAYAICRACGVDAETFVKAFISFVKPPHRVEFVSTKRGVSYYDDSKGTSIDAVAKAVQSLQGKTVLIAGGLHKGASYCPWKESFNDRVHHVFAIGEAAPLIKGDLEGHCQVEICESLEHAVRRASECAKPGENILLSPGCASYDMFKDYKHRGEKFKEIVAALEGEIS